MIHVNKAMHRGKYNNSKVGKFIPVHPEKYTGEKPIIYKSNLELKMMRYLDRNDMIVKWAYEKFSIRYMDKSSNPPKPRNYHIDFVAYAKDGKNGLKQLWIEVKSQKEVDKPTNGNRIDMLTWIKNQCKWKAATLLAESKGCKFKIITEEHLD